MNVYIYIVDGFGKRHEIANRLCLFQRVAAARHICQKETYRHEKSAAEDMKRDLQTWKETYTKDW